MTFTDTPQPFLSSVKDTFQNANINASQSNAIFDADHVKFNDPNVIKRGNHKKVTVISLNATPVPSTGEIILYSKKSTEGDPSEDKTKLFGIRDTDTAEYPFQAMRAFGTFKLYPNTPTPPTINPKSFGFLSIETIPSTATYSIKFKENFADENYTVVMTPSTAVGILERNKDFLKIGTIGLLALPVIVDIVIFRGF